MRHALLRAGVVALALGALFLAGPASVQPTSAAAPKAPVAQPSSGPASPGPIESGNPRGEEGLLSRVLAPGPLIRGHESFESACLKCHIATKGTPDSQCLECHTEIRKEVGPHRGFHGLLTEACAKCHTDHQGRNHDTTEIDPARFDHKKTSFPLEGRHEQLDCVRCHTARRGDEGRKVVRPNEPRYTGLNPDCVSCHRKADVHFFPDTAPDHWARKDCSVCHSGSRAWSMDTHFDHEKQAHYALVGKHAELKCTVCHVPRLAGKTGPVQYEWPNLHGSQCLTCHAEHHKDKLSPEFRGGDCARCHSQATWKIPRFDHSVTGFRLEGKHARITCVDCHRQSPGVPLAASSFRYTGLSAECISCHKDFHGFGEHRSEVLGDLSRCQVCHSAEAWRPAPRFNHDTDTRYPITGRHLEVSCNNCHLKVPGQAGQAAGGVAETARPGPLRLYHWEQLPTKTCETCHRSPHTKVFPPELLARKCTACHGTAGWKVIANRKGARFDHNRDTRFELTGAHTKTSCVACHLSGRSEKFKFANFEKGFCVDCHRSVHLGQFDEKFAEASCGTCHTTSNFTVLKRFNHSTTRFALTGTHAALGCGACHRPGARLLEANSRKANVYLFANADRQFCIDCHRNVHQGQFKPYFSDSTCAACHTTTDFVHREPFHHDTTGFRLLGAHAQVTCSQCHLPAGQSLPGMPGHSMHRFVMPGITENTCTPCHRDPHQGVNGPNCIDCHGEQTWKQVKNFHQGLTLTGTHAQLSCQECHRSGAEWRRLSGLSQRCQSCHEKDDIHNRALPACGNCHTQQLWELITFKHSMTAFPLRGYHRTLDCTDCHINNIYQGAPSSCVACHRQNALNFRGQPNHQLLLNRACSDCHNQFSFF